MKRFAITLGIIFFCGVVLPGIITVMINIIRLEQHSAHAYLRYDRQNHQLLFERDGETCNIVDDFACAVILRDTLRELRAKQETK